MSTSPETKLNPTASEKPEASTTTTNSNTEAKNEDQFSPNVIKEDVVRTIKTCYDPEIPVNIYELGLIYNVEVNEERFVTISMTLTSPNCPAAESLPHEVTTKTKNVPGVADAKVEVVWEPVWNKDMMTEAAQLQLGLL